MISIEYMAMLAGKPIQIYYTLYFNSMEEFENSFGPNADKIMADLPNFTNIEPTIQVSEVMI